MKYLLLLTLLLSTSAFARISQSGAVQVALEEMQREGGSHFGTDSWKDYLDITTVVSKKEYKKMLKISSKNGNTDFSDFLTQYPYSENFYVNVEVSDCVIQWILYVVNKSSGKLVDQISDQE
ncbi:MAG: hypothetical protein HOE90_02610 [Bacteriovoracaceae bacterium]|jgi:hypothetical protein|nr:hypothetical protein [Bacteriovoracaceae bacterium]